MTQEPPQSWPPPDDVRPWSVPAVDPLSGAPLPGGVGPEPASWAAGYPAPWPGSTSGPQPWPQPGYPVPYHPAPYHPAPYHPGPYAQPYAGPYATAPTNGFAIAALVLGVIWVFWVGSVLAVVFGHLARQQIRRTGERGDQLAVAGLVLGWIGIGFLALTLFGVILDSS